MSHAKRLLLTITILAITLTAIPALAQEKPIQLSLFAPIQLVDAGNAVAGVRLSLLYGKNTSVTGLDWGLVNHSTAGISKGVQFGVVGMVEADFVGWQDNFVSITRGNLEGFQSGFVNYAGHASGFQLGLVNYAVTMHGLQIGLVNIIKDRKSVV